MERRLSAILAADMVGYSRLIEADEAGTLKRQKGHRRELINPALEKFDGRIVKEMGDGVLVEFPSVVNAVTCALTIQCGMPEREAAIPEGQRITYRVGINLGDVVVEEGDIFGDGVNVAARLEQLSEPGGICISGTAYDQIEGRSEFVCSFLGEKQLKNISRPIRIYRVSSPVADIARSESASEGGHSQSSDKPSVAVLPFNNFSADVEQEFFADGIVEDLITALSRFPWLFVVARNSTFSYKGKHVQIPRLAAELGVRYVVEGSVRSSKTRLRVSVQLIEASTGNHVWAENYDRPTGELFELQDEITASITGVLVPALSEVERLRSMRENRPDLDAWQVFQKGLAYFYRPYSDADNAKAREYFDQAVALDPSFADAHAMIALMGTYALDSGQTSYTASPAEILAEAEIAAKTAVQHGDKNALAHLALGRVYSNRGKYGDAVAECESAIQLNPNLAIAHHELGFVLLRLDRYEDAIQNFDRAITLSPNDPSRWNFYLLKGMSNYGLERFTEAIACAREAARLRPAAFWPWVFLATFFSALDRLDEARASLDEALERKPDFGSKFLENWIAVRRERTGSVPSYMTRLAKDLSKVDLRD